MSTNQHCKPTQAWMIRAILLPDGDQPTTLWLRGGKILQSPVEDALELPGNYLLPGGLIDSHAHLSIDFANTGLEWGSTALIAHNWRRQLTSGVLHLRDAGVTPNAWLDEEKFEGRLFSSGRMLAPTGRYHQRIGNWVPAEQLIPSALAEVNRGLRWIKFIADFPGADGDWFNAPATYDCDLIRKLVEEVHTAGARVLAHTTGPIANQMVELGVDSIEHGPSLTADSVRIMADQGIAWTPTVWTMMKNVGPALTLPEPIGDYLRGKIEEMQENLNLAVRLGVQILAGSDEAPHGSLYREIQELSAFGLSPQQALCTATDTPRSYLRLPSTQTKADFVTFWEDPRRNLATLAEPATVVIDGRVS